LWEQEQITEADVAALGTDHADILLAHDSPPTASLHARLAKNSALWSSADLAYARQGQDMFMRAFLATSPRLAVGGHYHLHHDVTERFHGAQWFESRVVILDADGEANSFAILDTWTLAIEFVNDDPRTARPAARSARTEGCMAPSE